MGDAIYLIGDDKRLLPMSETLYDSEPSLQELLADYPELLAGDQIDPVQPRRWLLVDREQGVPEKRGSSARWSVDHLFLDQDGVPTLVEVKRSTNTEIRRQVVGQMMDYAANAVLNWSVDRIQEKFEARCKEKGKDPEEELYRHLADPEADPERFWQAVETNLRAGRIRLIFVADQIPPELKRIVEFLSGQMRPAEVLAIEVKQYTGQGQRALVPRLLTGTNYSNGFLEELSRNCDHASVHIFLSIESWAGTRSLSPRSGGGKTYKTWYPILPSRDRNYHLFAIRTDCQIEFWFGEMRDVPPFDDRNRRLEIIHRLNKISGFRIPEKAVGGYPKIPLKTLMSPQIRNQFLAVFDWVIDEIRRYEGTAAQSER